MGKLKILGMAALLAATTALADDDMGRTTTDMDENDMNGVFDSPITLALDAGILSFQEPGSVGSAVDNAETNNRFLGGLRLNWDMTNFGDVNPVHAGLTTGLYYSRLNSGPSDSNFFQVPLNAQLGFTALGNIHLAAHGGANMIVQDSDSAIDLGRGSDGDTSIEFYPNLGANLGIGFGRGLGISLRGDYTIAPSDDLLVGTLGLVVPLA